MYSFVMSDDSDVAPAVAMLDGGVAVHTSGRGPALVLLHANGGDCRDFDAVVAQLGQRWTVHAVDWPGHGESASSSIERSACGFARLLPSILRQLPGGPFVLVGNSVGGFAAIHAAAEVPDLVSGLVVVQPGGFTPRWPLTRLACRIIGSSKVSGCAMRLLPKVYLWRQTVAVREIRQRAQESSRRPEAVTTFGSVWRSFTDSAHDSRADAARVTQPTLLVWGLYDPILPWLIDGRRARRAFRNAHTIMLRCGHQAFAEMPQEFVALVDRFATENHL